MSGRVLIVDDDPDMCELMLHGLAKRGFQVQTVPDGNAALELLGERDFDVVVADVQLDGMSGIELCQRVAESRPDTPVVVITAHGSMDVAIQSMRAGAYDFINKPVRLDMMALTLGRAVRHRELSQELRRLRDEKIETDHIANLVGDSAAMRRVYDLVSQVATSDATVLITGESGTGKELVARAIHDGSARASRPFVALNCAAMPASLLESELFGHVKGAFTDARQAREGLFVRADGGTIFLDEIGEMPGEMQAKLLRVLQERRARPVGGDREVQFDVRILAATNRDLETDVEDKRFREDLYYRINVVRIDVPPLRSRGNDVLILAQHFVSKFANASGKDVSGISGPAAEKLLSYDWPGNVRELENSMERAVMLTKFDQLTVDDLPDKIREHQSSRLVISSDDPEEMPSLEEVERRYIFRVLKATGGNKTHAARVLGLDRRTLYRKIDRLAIDLSRL